MAKLRHVAIKCDDLEWGAEFYRDTFELEEVGRVGDMQTGGAVYLSDGVMNVALIKVSPDFPNAKPEGINHIGFVVPDIDAAVARAEAHGCTSMLGNMDRDAAKAAGITWEVKMKTPDGVAFDIADHGWPGNTQLYDTAAAHA